MAPRRTLNDERWPATLPLALGFELMRQLEAGLMDAPRQWMEQIVGRASPDQILDELDSYLRGTAPVKLSEWVAFEMPSNEAFFVDDRTHIIRAAIVSILMTINLDRPPKRFTVGEGVATHRDRVLAELRQLAAADGVLGDRFGVVDLEAKSGAVRRALEEGFAARDRASRDRIRHGHLDSERAERLLRKALVAEWASGFPRSVLSAATKRSSPWRPGTPAIVVSQLELKEFFLTDQLEPSTMEMMGANWARAILTREEEMLVERLASLRKYSWRLRTIQERLERAKSVLEGRGHPPTHLIGPWHWGVWQSLLEPAVLHGARPEGGAIGQVFGLNAYEASHDFDFVVVLSLPRAITVRQRTFAGAEFDVSVRAIGPEELERLRLQGITDVDGDQTDEPVERIQMRAWVTIRESVVFEVSRSAAVAVAVPPELLD